MGYGTARGDPAKEHITNQSAQCYRVQSASHRETIRRCTLGQEANVRQRLIIRHDAEIRNSFNRTIGLSNRVQIRCNTDDDPTHTLSFGSKPR